VKFYFVSLHRFVPVSIRRCKIRRIFYKLFTRNQSGSKKSHKIWADYPSTIANKEGDFMKRFVIFMFMMALVLIAAVSVFNISNAAGENLKVQMFNSNTAATTNSISPKIKLINQGSSAISLSTVTIRYYYTVDGDKAQSYWCDYASVTPGYTAITSAVTGKFVKMSTPATGADYYLEIGFTSAAGSLSASGSAEIQSRFAKTDWSNYTQTGDYSFNATATNYADTTKVTVYVSGTLIGGTEPGGTAPTPVVTPTPVRTATPTGATPTPVRTVTTRTPTPVIRTATPTLAPTPTPSTAGKFHCFLLLGQSNMAGYPKAQASDLVEDPRVLVLGYDNNPALGRVTDQWDVACPPLHETYQGAIGPGDWFAKTLIQRYPAGDTIGLIPCAISGERIETFMKAGGSKYSWIINRAKLAQQRGGIIEGILFHQGESNNGDTSWPGKVKQLVQDLKADLGLGNVPFLAGELLYSGSCAGHNTLVNQLPSQITNCYVISASGLVVDPADTQWRLHFGHDSQVEFGKRYAAKMIQALGL
jgi:hypothetical protein